MVLPMDGSQSPGPNVSRPRVTMPHVPRPHLPVSGLPKPRLRGWLHQIAFFVSIPAGIALVALARGAQARVGTMVFAATLTGLYGVSAAYHRGRWSERAHRVWRRRYRSMMYVFIDGTCRPVTLLALHPAWGITLLALAWSGAVWGVLISPLRLERWHGVGFALYLVLGWFGAVALVQLVR